MTAKFGEPRQYTKRHVGETLDSVHSKRAAILAQAPPPSDELLQVFKAAGWPASYVDAMLTGSYLKGIKKADGSTDWDAYANLLGFTTANAEAIRSHKELSDLRAEFAAFRKHSPFKLLPKVDWQALRAGIPDREVLDELRWAHNAIAQRDLSFDEDAVINYPLRYAQPYIDEEIDRIADSLPEIQLHVELQRKLALYHYKLANGDMHWREAADWLPKQRDESMALNYIGNTRLANEQGADVYQSLVDSIPPWDKLIELLNAHQQAVEDAEHNAKTGGVLSEAQLRDQSITERVAALTRKTQATDGSDKSSSKDASSQASKDGSGAAFLTARDEDHLGTPDDSAADPPGIARLWLGILGPEWRAILAAAQKGEQHGGADAAKAASA